MTINITTKERVNIIYLQVEVHSVAYGVELPINKDTNLNLFNLLPITTETTRYC